MIDFEPRSCEPADAGAAAAHQRPAPSTRRPTRPTRPVVQARLTVGSTDDPAEHEADRIAALVMRSLATLDGAAPAGDSPEPRVRRAPGPGPTAPEPATRVRRAPQAVGAGPDGGALDAETERGIDASRGSGHGLHDGVLRRMEAGFGADFSHVRIHHDGRSDDLARRVQATAFTTGSDIYFRRGAYEPSTSAGQELLAHELTHVVQQTGTVARVQRRIGFEIETGIPLTKRVADPGGDYYDDIYANQVGGALPITRGKLLPDHIPGNPAHVETPLEQFDEWPIIELVTDPVDDGLSMAAFTLIATSWLTSLQQIKALAQAGPPAQQLLGDYHVGLPSAQPYADWDRIAPQVTVGVPLDQVPTVLAAFDETQGIYRAQLATQIGQQAGSVAARVMQDLFDQYPPTDGPGVAAVKGLLTMIVNHLMVGGNQEISRQVYMKNRSANVMFKTKLSSVRDNIVDHPYAATVLADPVARAFVKARLLAVTGRAPGDPVFVAYTQGPPARHTEASTATVGTWLDQVLGGVDDTIFDDMKNQWSTELDPDDPDEVVIELRRVGAFVSHDDYSIETGGLLRFLQKVYGVNQLYKQRKL